jgi:hypothetical protein
LFLRLGILLSKQLLFKQPHSMKNFKLLIAALFLGLGAFANNISISSLVYNSGAGTVTFNISWENSWRVSTAPNI